ncbi:MAG: hypothetical protein ACRBB5_04375 [Nitrosopumilus sp.]
MSLWNARNVVNFYLVSISGGIDLQNAQTVNIVKINIINLDKNNIVIEEYIPVSDDNSFSISYDSSIWAIGEYEVTIGDDEIEETTYFEISESSSSSGNDPNAADDVDNTLIQESSPDVVLASPIDLKADVISSTQIDISCTILMKMILE